MEFAKACSSKQESWIVFALYLSINLKLDINIILFYDGKSPTRQARNKNFTTEIMDSK